MYSVCQRRDFAKPQEMKGDWKRLLKMKKIWMRRLEKFESKWCLNWIRFGIERTIWTQLWIAFFVWCWVQFLVWCAILEVFMCLGVGTAWNEHVLFQVWHLWRADNRPASAGCFDKLLSFDTRRSSFVLNIMRNKTLGAAVCMSKHK